MQGTALIDTNMDDVQVFLDGNLVGTVSPGKPLALPGLAAGRHRVQGVREGYDPITRGGDRAGTSAPVTIRIRDIRR